MPSRQLPLVMYRKGVRTEIGMAIVEDDGSITAQVKKDDWPMIRDLFMPNVGEFSINPAPSKQLDLLYNEASKHVHPKIQER